MLVNQLPVFIPKYFTVYPSFKNRYKSSYNAPGSFIILNSVTKALFFGWPMA
jgi:hypothetical protein